ncbi:ABC transporter permease [Pontibacillus yanchengensis]|uniref:ABC transporter permease n=2 Tax=Pontibacillus yanchengensis TaxID=462910 RepID=A0ACC7VFH9_9BACI|nr:ABC transporter permease [Pontibacillus yanchengensis]MYL32374.1 ABC transporter permease [Pontibacillus yanchengensis]MYL52954.1 ABC transporter permease [Pontibacillus yanchengensis]
MNKFFVILAHTYLNRLKSKAFIITTVITLLLIVGLANFQNIISTFSGEEEQVDTVAVIDETDSLFSRFQEQVKAQEDVMEVEEFDDSEEEAKKAVQEGEYKGLLTLTLNESDLPEGTYYSNQMSEMSISGKLQQGLQQLKVAVATENAGIEESTIQQIYSPVSFEKVSLAEDSKSFEELNETRGLVYIMLFLLYFGVLMYGNMIAMEVATEKSSRVMEILISSVSPVTQMFGKICGIALLGITQFSLILLVGYQSIKSNMESMSGGGFTSYFGFSNVEISTLIYAILFFLLGYLLYATLAAMLGSIVSRIEDAQQVITPMTLLIVAAFMLAMFGLNVPESTFVTVTSFIPFFTPMLMFLRVGMLEIPFWESSLGILLLIGTIILLAVIGARVYRGGVLLYGRSSSLKDLKKAMQLSKKE